MTFWRSKPPPGVRIDPSHPLAQGLALCYALNEGAGYPSDCAGRLNQVALNNSSINAAPAWSARDGVGMSFPSSSYLRTNTGNALADAPFNGDLSLVVRALSTTASAQDVVNKMSSAGATLTVFDLQIRSTGALTLVRSNSGFRDHVGPVITANAIQTWGVSSHRLIETLPTFYLNGVGSIATLGSGSGTGQPASNTADIHVARRLTSTLTFAGTIWFIGIWSRLLSAQEHAEMAANPYQIFEAPAWTRIQPVVGGGGSGARSMVVVAG
jgi:hypothetical protein